MLHDPKIADNVRGFALQELALLLAQRWKYSRQLFEVGNSSFASFRVFELAFVYSAIELA
jgi:hypothetical protein